MYYKLQTKLLTYSPDRGYDNMEGAINAELDILAALQHQIVRVGYPKLDKNKNLMIVQIVYKVLLR